MLRWGRLVAVAFAASACAPSDDDATTAPPTLALDGVPQEIASVRAVTNTAGSQHAIEVTLADGTGVYLTFPGVVLQGQHYISASQSDVAAVVASPGEEPWTWYARAEGFSTVSMFDPVGEALDVTVDLQVSRYPDETLAGTASFDALELGVGDATYPGSVVRFRLAAFSDQGNVYYRSGPLTSVAVDTRILVTASGSEIIGVGLTLPRDAVPGRYDLGLGEAEALGYDGDYSGDATSGMIEVTTHDPATQHLVGTFAFSGTAMTPGGEQVPLLVTTGSFDLFYTRAD